MIFHHVSFETKAQKYYCGVIEFGVSLGVEFCDFEMPDAIVPCSFILIDTLNHSNIWQKGSPKKTYFNDALSLPNAIITDTINPYPINNHSSFDICMPTLLDSSYQSFMSTSVSFMHKINSDTLNDGGYIEFRYYKDSSWSNWINIADDTLSHNYCDYFNCKNLYGSQDTLFNGQAGFSGTTNWIETTLQWVWNGPRNNIRADSICLRFNFVSDGVNTNKDGWMIDNIWLEDNSFAGGLEENNYNHKIEVLPNPVSSVSTVILKGQDSLSLSAELYNIFGQKVKDFPEIRNNTFTIERGIHESGIKFLVLKNESKIIAVKKIIFL